MPLQVVQARDTAATECAALRAELDRFRECTGKSVEALEQEKACRATLQSLNQAQVSTACRADSQSQNQAQVSFPC